MMGHFATFFEFFGIYYITENSSEFLNLLIIPQKEELHLPKHAFVSEQSLEDFLNLKLK